MALVNGTWWPPQPQLQLQLLLAFANIRNAPQLTGDALMFCSLLSLLTNKVHTHTYTLTHTDPTMSECARKGLANKPVKGDALMFYSLTPDGKEDPKSLHGSCPTTKG